MREFCEDTKNRETEERGILESERRKLNLQTQKLNETIIAGQIKQYEEIIKQKDEQQRQEIEELEKEITHLKNELKGSKSQNQGDENIIQTLQKELFAMRQKEVQFSVQLEENLKYYEDKIRIMMEICSVHLFNNQILVF